LPAVGFSRRVVLLVVAALVLAGGGVAAGVLISEDGSSGSSSLERRYVYPQSAKNVFLSACTKHSRQSVCDCVVRAYEATMPYGIYKDIARGGVQLNNKAYYQAFTQASGHCSS
jgi:hypothetical protein